DFHCCPLRPRPAPPPGCFRQICSMLTEVQGIFHANAAIRCFEPFAHHTMSRSAQAQPNLDSPLLLREIWKSDIILISGTPKRYHPIYPEPQETPSMKFETLAIHAGYQPDPTTKSVAVPI